jgi:hypothetical protein
MPIRLMSFNATKLSSTKSLVSWQAADLSSAAETFEIQRAGNDKHFSTIGVVPGSETSHIYSYTDTRTKPGVNYYRLRMTDKDGDVSFSRAVAVMNNIYGTTIASLFPTLVVDRTTLTVTTSNNQKLDISITDLQGKLMLRQSFTIGMGTTNIELSTRHYAAGTYIISGSTDEGKVHTMRFVKQ